MPHLPGPSPRGRAAPRRAFWPAVLLMTAAMAPSAAAYMNTAVVDVAALPPNSFVNFSDADQLAAYAQSQALPRDANVTRACGCECLPSWTHMILPDYASARDPLPPPPPLAAAPSSCRTACDSAGNVVAIICACVLSLSRCYLIRSPLP